MVHIPHKARAPSLADRVGGHVDMVVSTLTSAVPLMKAGKVRPIAVTSLERSAEWPEVPTLNEAGLKGFQADGWNGLSAPARTPRELIDRINGDVGRILQSPDVVDKLLREGAAPKRTTPAQFRGFVRDDVH